MPSCIYPDDEWGPEFLEALKAPIRYLPPDWRARIELPAPPAEPDACEQLEGIIKARPHHLADIVAQAQSRVAAIQPVLKLTNLYVPPKDATLKLIFAVLDEVRAPTFLLKKEFKRGRPRQCCPQKLDPMFRGERLDPLHPAYPSGHSVQAHAAAEVLASLDPSKGPQFHLAADGVARNREIAGLHYRSDSAAGAELARQLVEFLKASPAFIAAYLEPACMEW